MNSSSVRGTAIGLFMGGVVLLLALVSDIGLETVWPPTASADSVCPDRNKLDPEPTIVEHYSRKKPQGDDYFGTAGDELLEEMKAINIENYLRYLTSQGHMAGTKQDLEQAEYLRKMWLEQGVDQVYLQPYNIQLSHPDIAKPNRPSLENVGEAPIITSQALELVSQTILARKDISELKAITNLSHIRVHLMDEDGKVKFTSSIMEEPIDGVEYDDSIPPAFLAFAPAGTIVTNELVYVNYGRYEDFEEVEAMGIKIKGRLVIAKFGKVFRGDKIQNAERFNASGVILYTDPHDYHPESENGESAYPHSLWLPGAGIQRGSIVWHDGDPTTPYYPSIDGAYRVPDEETDSPKIPAHCLSYNDARKLLINMGGAEAPASWTGRLNITYRIGPQLGRTGWTVKLEVNNVKRIVPTYNVIGIIRGSEEPDRYVIAGNHRDSWVFGSLDPSSATAVQMEMVRSFGQLMKKGWRPRRSIVFGSWGAGEYGFFGPWEWVEEYLKVFEMRAVAHLNVDLAIIYDYNIQISATPMLHKVIKEATKRTPAPDKSLGYETLWDHWTDRVRAASPDLLDWKLASISEHAPFFQRIGVPTSYMVWEINFEELDWSDYPLYHTTYEDFNAIKTILDPEFRYHLSMSHLWGLMTIGLADAKILPMDPEDEIVMLQKMLDGLREEFGTVLKEKGISLAHLESVINRFAEVVRDFNQRIHADSHNISPLYARQLNDQLVALEKCYVDAEGSPYRPHMKNKVFGTNNFNQYDEWMAPAVRDALWQAMNNCKGSCKSQWQLVAREIAALQYVINSALLMMKDIQFL